MQEILDNSLRGNETSNYEPEFRTKWNEIRYLLVNSTTRRDANNNVVGVVGVAQDVTEAAKSTTKLLLPWLESFISSLILLPMLQ